MQEIRETMSLVFYSGMKSEISSKLALLIIGLGGAALFFTIIFSISLGLSGQNSYAQQSASVQKIASVKKENLELPVRLKIPKISVDAPVISVGLANDGAMVVPKGPGEAAWFNLGPRPGEIGSSVISGHYGWKNNVPAVFDNLYKLKKGDRIYAEDGRGVVASFVVRESRIYGENQDASDVFGSIDGEAHLNLITCGGVWDKVRKSYSNRLVVFADKE